MTAEEMAGEVSAHLGSPVKGTRMKHGIRLEIPGHALFVSDGNPFCAKQAAANFRITADLHALHPLEEGIKPEEQTLLDQLK